MANGLLDYLSGFGSTPPEYLGGLLGQDAVDKLKGRAATTGIANAVLGYLAAPKNQNLGLGRIIGQSLQAGMTGAQGVYDTATQDYMMQQKIDDLQRKQARDVKVQDMISGIADPKERLAAEIAPEQYVAASLKPQKAFNILTPEQTTAYGLPTDKGQRYQMTETGVSLIGGTETKDRTTKEIDAGNKILIVDAVTGQTIREVPKALAPTKPTEPSYSIQTDKNGKAIYVPNKPGMAAIDATTGKPTVYEPKFEEKPLTEGQGKAANFYKRMSFASQKFNVPMIDKSTKQPLLNEDGSPMTLEDYVGNPSRIAQTLRSIPSFGLTSEIAEAGIGENRQKIEALKENWITANLRKESGAVIGDAEFAREDKKYFPQLNDTYETRLLKKELRRVAEEGMLLESGKGGSTPTQQGWSIKKVGG
jgi:hypothetical protein